MTIGTATQEGNVSITLPNGTYKIKAVKGNGNLTASAAEITSVNANFYGAFNFTATGYFSVTGSKLIGGLRVRKITTYDPASNKSTYKIYQYNNGALSSGRVNYIPNYHYTYTEKGACKPDNSPANTPYFIQTFVFDVASSFSNSPLTQMKGSVVGYGKVTVLDGEELNGLVSPNGKTENFFTNPIDNVPYTPSDGALNFCYLNTFVPGQNQYPFAPSISLDFERGLLTDQIIYKSQNNAYVKVKEVLNDYKSDYFGIDAYANSTTDVIGAKVGVSYRTYGNLAPYYMFPTQYYFIPSRIAKLIKTDEIEYDNSGNQFHNVTQYAYDNTNHFQLSRSIHPRSDSVVETTQYLYPLDYSNSSGFIADMKSANIISSPIETVRFQTATDNSVTITGAQLKNYKASTQVGLLDKTYKIESVQPIPLSQFKFSNQSVAGSLPSSGTIASYGADSKYPAIPYYSFAYDNVSSKLNNTQERLVKNISYQWGYNGLYPVAQATNAKSNDIFFDGFEEGTGNSALNNSKTGHYSHTGSYSKALTGLDAGNYLLTYWQISGGAWTFLSTPVTVVGTTYSISLNAQIDDVRFYPTGAQMTTYTYDPLVGMTTATDPKNQVSYYEYDGFQRLINIKDKDGYIVKHFDYHYSGQ
jgi:YD repeat-containing protein